MADQKRKLEPWSVEDWKTATGRFPPSFTPFTDLLVAHLQTIAEADIQVRKSLRIAEARITQLETELRSQEQLIATLIEGGKPNDPPSP
mgnify:CR=1 FL=1